MQTLRLPHRRPGAKYSDNLATAQASAGAGTERLTRDACSRPAAASGLIETLPLRLPLLGRSHPYAHLSVPSGVGFGPGLGLLPRPPSGVPRQHSLDVVQLGLHVSRLDDHQQSADGHVQRISDVALQRSQLDQIAVALGAEVNTVRVHD